MTRHTKRLIGMAAAAAIALAQAPLGRADLIVLDDFEDGAAFGEGNTTGLEWFSGAGDVTLSVIDDSAGLGSGQALSGVVAGVSLNVIAAEFSEVNLLADGEFISVTLDFRYDDSISPVAATTGFIPSFGFFNTNGTTGAVADDAGYSANFPSLGGGNITFGKEGFNSPFGILAGDEARSQFGVSASEPALVSGENYTFAFKITKAPFGVVLALDVDGQRVLTASDTQNPLGLSFDQFALRNRFTDFVIDNVLIESGMDDLRPFLGDFNLDDSVDELDYFILRDHFGPGTTPFTGDMNFDGRTDLKDFDLFMGFFEAAGHSPASLPAIPEPTTLALLTPAAGLLLARRKREGGRHV